MQSERQFLHVDMDAFFASIEQRDHPEWRGKPVIVAGIGQRGVVSTASYEARAFGVHSALATAIARQRCPEGIYVEPVHSRYEEVSEQVMEVLESITPLVEPLSLDEAFMDVTGSQGLFGTPEQIGHIIRERVYTATGLTCSVGGSRRKFLSKMATSRAKPSAHPRGVVPGSGVHIIAAGEEQTFLDSLPVTALWGVGPATAKKLHALGLVTVRDLRETPLSLLKNSLGQASAQHLFEIANGRDHRGVSKDRSAKSMSREVTFSSDVTSRARLHAVLSGLVQEVVQTLRNKRLTAQVVTIKVRFEDFSTVTRQVRLDRPTNLQNEVDRVSRDLLTALDPTSGVRLIGVGLTQLVGENAGPAATMEVEEQLQLFSPTNTSTGTVEDDTTEVEHDQQWDAVYSALDGIKSKFGRNAIGSARTMSTEVEEALHVAASNRGRHSTAAIHRQGKADEDTENDSKS